MECKDEANHTLSGFNSSNRYSKWAHFHTLPGEIEILKIDSDNSDLGAAESQHETTLGTFVD